MNYVMLRGNVGGDPRITTFQDGGKVAQFSLATTERGFKTQDGRDVPEKTTWHNIVVKTSGLAGVCEQYVKKGTPLLIVGKIENREYQDNAGQTRYITEIIVRDMELLGGKPQRDEAPAPEPEYRHPGISQPQYSGPQPLQGQYQEAVPGYTHPNGSKGDLPF